MFIFGLAFALAIPAYPQGPDTTFKKLAAQLVEKRLNGEDIKESSQEEVLRILDDIVLANLNSSAPDLNTLNARLAKLVAQEPALGEGYTVVALGTGGPAPAAPPAYALAANCGLSGPSAVRVYAGAVGALKRVARVDAFQQKDFFDEYLEVVPLPGAAAVFVTVTGRTDELQTGSFAAWHLDGENLKLLWSTEILEQSSYDAGPNGFQLTFCAQPDEDRPSVCRQMVRERYVWSGGEWKRAERQPLPAAKP